MTKDDIIRMAKEVWDTTHNGYIGPSMERLERFAALVAKAATEEANRRANGSWTLMCEKMVAAEREACAKVCDEAYIFYDDAVDSRTLEICAAAIRARGQQ